MCVLLAVPPKLELKNMRDQTVKAGQTVKLNVKFTGSPYPTAKWSHTDKDLTADERTKVGRINLRPGSLLFLLIC